MRVYNSPHPHQYLVLVITLIFANLVDILYLSIYLYIDRYSIYLIISEIEQFPLCLLVHCISLFFLWMACAWCMSISLLGLIFFVYYYWDISSSLWNLQVFFLTLLFVFLFSFSLVDIFDVHVVVFFFFHIWVFWIALEGEPYQKIINMFLYIFSNTLVGLLLWLLIYIVLKLNI